MFNLLTVAVVAYFTYDFCKARRWKAAACYVGGMLVFSALISYYPSIARSLVALTLGLAAILVCSMVLDP